MSDIQPELWVEHPSEAIAFYQAAFGAVVAHRVGDSEDIVAQLAVRNARFWIANADAENGRCHPAALGGGTSRTLLVVDDPDAVVEAASGAGATVTSPVSDEHGWRLGRITDPCGHRWEIGKPTGPWPPRNQAGWPECGSPYEKTIEASDVAPLAPYSLPRAGSTGGATHRLAAPAAAILVSCRTKTSRQTTSRRLAHHGQFVTCEVAAQDLGRDWRLFIP